jgi:hypothetical protein
MRSGPSTYHLIGQLGREPLDVEARELNPRHPFPLSDLRRGTG